MTIGDKTVHMLVDTGGVVSMLTPPVVSELDLSQQVIPLSHIRQYGGFVIDHYVTAHDISLGGLKTSKLDLLVMPEHGYAPDIGGLLAPDIMRRYDVDFDFANATLSLFSQDHCEGQVVYWTHDPYGVVDIELNEFGQMTVPVTARRKGNPRGHRYRRLPLRGEPRDGRGRIRHRRQKRGPASHPAREPVASALSLSIQDALVSERHDQQSRSGACAGQPVETALRSAENSSRHQCAEAPASLCRLWRAQALRHAGRGALKGCNTSIRRVVRLDELHRGIQHLKPRFAAR